MNHPLQNPALRPLWFVLGSCSLTLFPFLLGSWLWPDGLNANAAMFFWPASGINFALCLKWGWKYSFLIYLNALVTIFCLKQPVSVSLAGATFNILEVWLGYGLLYKFAHRLQAPLRVQHLLMFLLCSILMGMLSAIPMAAVMVHHGRVSAMLYGQTVASIAAANACGILYITPLFFTFPFPGKPRKTQPLVFFAGGVLLAVVALLAFNRVFQGRLNYVFALYPVLTFFTLRFSFKQISFFLFIVFVSIYGALIQNAFVLPVEQTPEILWFVQAFSWVLASTALVFSVLILVKRQQDLTLIQQENDLLELQLREKDAQLNALRYQINPHFLFNSLNSIYVVMFDNSGKARKMITQLSEFFRASLTTPVGKKIKVTEAVEEVMLYLGIEKLRYEENLQINVEVDPRVAVRMIPPFLLQPLVENAVHHGFNQTQGVFELTIRAGVLSERDFYVEVSHPGTWQSSSEQKGTGVGIQNIQERLRLWYDGQARLETRLDDQQVSQRLVFPEGAEDIS